MLLPITATPPAAETLVYELPQMEVMRIARSGKTRLWVVLSEVNVDVIDGSYYLEPNCKITDLSPLVFKEIFQLFTLNYSRIKKVRRYD